MFLTIDHHSGVPIYRQVMEHIRRQIMTGQLQEGDRLLSVRVLGERLRVNPMTISKAYSLLEADQLLERRRGVGLFVARLSRSHLARDKKALLTQAMKQAALMAVQLGLPPDEAEKMFTELYRQHSPNTPRSK